MELIKLLLLVWLFNFQLLQVESNGKKLLDKSLIYDSFKLFDIYVVKNRSIKIGVKVFSRIKANRLFKFKNLVAQCHTWSSISEIIFGRQLSLQQL